MNIENKFFGGKKPGCVFLLHDSKQDVCRPRHWSRKQGLLPPSPQPRHHAFLDLELGCGGARSGSSLTITLGRLVLWLSIVHSDVESVLSKSCLGHCRALLKIPRLSLLTRLKCVFSFRTQQRCHKHKTIFFSSHAFDYIVPSDPVPRLSQPF